MKQSLCIISSEAKPLCHFERNAASLSFRAERSLFVIPSGAQPLCHFERSAASLSFRAERSGVEKSV